MDSKSLLRAVLLNITLILLAPTVYGCVNLFVAQGESNGVVQATWLDGKLWDGGSGSFTQVCTLSGNADANGNYDFKCDSGYSATLADENPYSDDGWLLQYSTPHGPYSFVPDYFPCGGSDGIYCSTWKSCQYGCPQGNPDCFVYNCGDDYSGCKPS